jgi:hypothetical protein
MFQKLVDDQPEDHFFCRDLALTLAQLGGVVRRLGRPAEARDGFDRAIPLIERLFQENPRNTNYRHHLADALLGRALASRDSGDPAEALVDARRALRLFDGLSSRGGGVWFCTAVCHMVLSGLAARVGSGLSATDASSEADTAMSLLWKAVRTGFRTVDAFRTSDALDPLRDRPDFRLLMMDLDFPADPFVRGR